MFEQLARVPLKSITWQRLWVPVMPALAIPTWLCGWALTEPDPVPKRVPIAALIEPRSAPVGHRSPAGELPGSQRSAFCGHRSFSARIWQNGSMTRKLRRHLNTSALTHDLGIRRAAGWHNSQPIYNGRGRRQPSGWRRGFQARRGDPGLGELRSTNEFASTGDTNRRAVCTEGTNLTLAHSCASRLGSSAKEHACSALDVGTDSLNSARAWLHLRRARSSPVTLIVGP